MVRRGCTGLYFGTLPRNTDLCVHNPRSHANQRGAPVFPCARSQFLECGGQGDEPTYFVPHASEPNLAASALESNGYASQHHGETDTGECVSKHLQVIGLVFLAYRDRVIDNTPLNMDDKAFIASQTTRIQAARRCRFSPLRDEG